MREMGTQPEQRVNLQIIKYLIVSQTDTKHDGSLNIFLRGLIEDHFKYEDVMYR